MTKKTETEENKTFAKEDISNEEINVAAETLVGDLRDAFLDRIKRQPKPWEQCSEAEQRDLVEHTTKFCKHMVTHAVKLIAANGRRTIVATLGKIELDSGLIKCRLETKITPETLLELSAAQDMSVLVIASDAAEFEGERAPAEIDPDQPDLEKQIAAKASKAKTSKTAA